MNTNMNIEQRYYVREVAGHLGISARTLFRYINSGVLPEPESTFLLTGNNRLRLWSKKEIELAKQILADLRPKLPDPIEVVKEMFGGHMPSPDELQDRLDDLKEQTKNLKTAAKIMSGESKTVAPAVEKESNEQRETETSVPKVS